MPIQGKWAGADAAMDLNTDASHGKRYRTVLP